MILAFQKLKALGQLGPMKPHHISNPFCLVLGVSCFLGMSVSCLLVVRPWRDGSPSPAIQRHRAGCCGVRPSSGRSGRSGNSYGSEASEGIAAYMPKEVPWGHRALHPCMMRSVSCIFERFESITNPKMCR